VAYEPLPVKAPRLSGAALRAFVALVESGFPGSLVRAQMLSQTGIAILRGSDAQDAAPLRESLPHPPRLTALRAPAEVIGAMRRGGQGFALPDSNDFTDAYREGRSDPEAVAEAVLSAIERDEAAEPPSHIVVAHDATDLRAQAAESAARWAAGDPLGPLDGVPVAVKDELDQTPYPTTVGTRFLGGFPAEADSEVVRRLRAEGALLLGKVNMHELGIGVTGLNPNLGACRNPWDPSRLTGGSSSGSAAAVASGLSPIAVGADGGGSIRIPAALCGVVGLKCTFGRISEHGAAPLCWNVAHVGPIAVSARDAALAYAVMAGPDPRDPQTLSQPPVYLESPREDLEGVRLGVYRPWFEDADPEVVSACQATLDKLIEAGATLVEVELPSIALTRLAHLVIIASEMRASQMGMLESHRSEYGLDTRLSFALASAFRADDYIHAMRQRSRLTRAYLAIFEDIDGLVSPTTGCAAPHCPEDALETGESNLELLDRIMRFAAPANLTGFPAISFPAGFVPPSLPVGFQVMGRPWSEPLLLRIAHVAEGWRRGRQPARFHRLLE